MNDRRQTVSPVALPMARVKALSGGMEQMVPLMLRKHALLWIMFTQRQPAPQVQQIMQAESWLHETFTALAGLLRMVLSDGQASPEVLMALADAINAMYAAQGAVRQPWDALLRAYPGARQDPLVRSIRETKRALAEATESIREPAAQVQRAIMGAPAAPLFYDPR